MNINFVTLLLSKNEKSESIPQYIDHILTFTQKELDSVYDSSIREKYLWLKKATKKVMQRFRSHIPHWLPNGDDLFGKWK